MNGDSAYNYTPHEQHRITTDMVIAAILGVATVAILAATIVLVAIVGSWT